jgi:hypothetical protein
VNVEDLAGEELARALAHHALSPAPGPVSLDGLYSPP